MTLVQADGIFFPDAGFVKGKSLLVGDGLIREISENLGDDTGTEVLDFRGCSLTPLFCDYHIHFTGEMVSGVGGLAGRLNRCGIVRVYDGGDSKMKGIEMKIALKGLVEIKAAGHALYKKGGYGKHLGVGVRNVGEAKAAIDSLYAAGADYIKIVNSGIFMPETGKISSGGFEAGELEETIVYAADRGLPVFCHANGERKINEAVSAGASAIIHGFYISDETISMMAERKTALIPTLNALYSLTTTRTDPEEKKRTERMVEAHLIATKKALDRGVRILAGSDAGPSFIPYGASFIAELRMLEKAGFSSEEVLAAAVTGPLMEGGRADFLVIRGTSVEKVFIGGESPVR